MVLLRRNYKHWSRGRRSYNMTKMKLLDGGYRLLYFDDEYDHGSYGILIRIRACASS